MSAGNTIRPLPVLKGEQLRASRPEAHVWLSASAGTGKTQVLAARVFRLLLRGVEPAAILCLTCLLYTSPSPRDQRGSRMPSSA